MISVIVPVYNTSAFLRECIESILSQTYGDFELILVDDGSTDGSGAVCDGYALSDSRVRVIHTGYNGVSAARNAGLDAICGEYVTFIDSDDMVHPRYLELLYKLAAESQCDIVSAGYVYAGTYVFKDIDKITEPDCYSPVEMLERILYQDFDSSVCWKLFSSAIFDGIRFEVGSWYEDLLMCISVYPRAGRISRITTPLYFYRRHPDSFVRRYSSRRFDILRVTDFIEKWTAESAPELLPAARSRKFSASYNVLLMVNKTPDASHDHDEECYDNIKRLRLGCLLDPKVRIKNKMGALVSFFGTRFIKLLAR